LHSTELKIVRCKNSELLRFANKPIFFRVYVSNIVLIVFWDQIWTSQTVHQEVNTAQDFRETVERLLRLCCSFLCKSSSYLLLQFQKSIRMPTFGTTLLIVWRTCNMLTVDQINFSFGICMNSILIIFQKNLRISSLVLGFHWWNINPLLILWFRKYHSKKFPYAGKPSQKDFRTFENPIFFRKPTRKPFEGFR
jgi:hypothetical protein